MRRALVILAATLALLALAAAGVAFARGDGVGVGSLFGDRMIRAEVVESDGAVFDLYRGRLAAAALDSVTVREADGHVDTVPIVATTRITLGGTPTGVAALRRGMRLTIVRPSNGAATIVQALRH
jgi:hypothetical protein